MTERKGGVYLDGCSLEELFEMQNKADDLGYCGGIPLGTITKAIEDRMNPQPRTRRPRRKSTIDTSLSTQQKLTDQFMEARMGPRWGRR